MTPAQARPMHRPSCTRIPCEPNRYAAATAISARSVSSVVLTGMRRDCTALGIKMIRCRSFACPSLNAAQHGPRELLCGTPGRDVCLGLLACELEVEAQRLGEAGGVVAADGQAAAPRGALGAECGDDQ